MRKISLRRTLSPKYSERGLQRTAKKCTEISHARAQPFFLLIKPFVLCRSRCRGRRGLLKQLFTRRHGSHIADPKG